MKERKNIEEKYTWDLEVIYKTIEEYNKDYKLVEDKIKEIEKYKDTITLNANNLYECILISYEIERLLDKMYTYSSLSSDLDTRDNSKIELKEKTSILYDKYNKVSYFIVPSILKIDYKQIEEYYKDNPKLKDYEITIRNIYKYKEHILEENEEKLLSSLGNMIGNNYNTYELFKDAELEFDDIEDEKGNKHKLDNSTYGVYIESKDRTTRKNAFKNLYKKYKQYTNTFTSILSNNIKEDITISKIKKYNSAMEMHMMEDEVKPQIVDNLIESVNKGLNYLYKYYEFKKRALNLDEIHLYDAYTPLIKDLNIKYPYEEAKTIVLKALSILGNDYIEQLEEGYNKRWIDVYPTKAKRTGGYSGGSYDTYPYILLNYQDRYDDMSTLAHESGHSMHSYYARTNNPYQYGDYTIFVAEVASTVNELLLANYMLENSKNNKEKLYILNRIIELYKATIFRQTMFAEFERDIYKMAEKDIPLTSNLLCEHYYKLNQKYFGDNIVIDEEIQYEWERIPHFYYNFYVYKYATGLSAATKIVTDILNGKDNAKDNYKEFLKCGRTKTPLDSLKLAGVNLESKEVIDNAINYFNEKLEEFIKLYEEETTK